MPCPMCPGKNKCISASGPVTSPYLFVGEAPGVDESHKGIPFVGKTGREVNEGYLPLAGLRRDDLRFTNSIRCLPDTPKHKLDLKKQAHKDLLHSCAEWHLYPEMERNQYKLIVPMGMLACHAIDPDIDLELQHGIPQDTAWGKVFPMYHPAGGIHMPKSMLYIRTDWARLRRYLKGTLTLPTDKYPNPDYQECESAEQLDRYMEGMEDYPSAYDTETIRGGGPFCITLSNRAGTGRLIRASNLACLQRLQFWLDRWKGVILFHNWLFDGEVVEEMGLKFPWRRIVDTMVKVFHLGNLPQGLKALSYRELGMLMQDFDDLVTPFSAPIVLDYYRQAYQEEWSKPLEQLLRTNDAGYKVYKPQGFNTKLKGFFTRYAKKEDQDVFDVWTNAWGKCPICKETNDTHTCIDVHGEVQKVLGPWPGKCISHVPFERVLFYSVRDADATLRLWPVIQHMERRVRKTVQEGWRYAA